MEKSRKCKTFKVAEPNEKARKIINIPYGRYLISEDNRIILANGELTPIVADTNYFHIENIEQVFDENQYVIFNDKNKSKIMQVVNFDYRTKQYKIVNVNDTKEIRFVLEKNLTSTHMYYFINSRGRICNAYYGYDKEADEWRINSGNYFSSNEEATKAKAETIAKSERNRC